MAFCIVSFSSSWRQGEPDRKKKYEILKKIIRKTSSLEQKWLVRLILKNMNIGMSINVPPLFLFSSVVIYVSSECA